MKILAKENKKSEPIKYPMLMTDGGRYAIATDRTSGILMGKGEMELIVSDSESWEEDGFYPYNGTVTISN